MSQAPAEAHGHDSHGDGGHGHGHDHDHPWFLGHHWENPKQQFEAGKLGMWFFLATEVLLFGGLFCGYAVLRARHPELFEYGSKFLDTKMGAINTGVLILSSMTMAMAVTYAQTNKTKLMQLCLVLTLLGAAGFMVIKYFEYTHKFHEGMYPGLAFYDGPSHPEQAKLWQRDPVTGMITGPADGSAVAPPPSVEGLPPGAEPSTNLPAAAPPTGLVDEQLDRNTISRKGPDFSYYADLSPLQDPDRPPNAHMFFNIYYMMTGLHGIHVVIGGVVIAWILITSKRYNSEYFTPVDLGGLYWHVVDLIWIFLFPLFYLI